MHLKVETSPIFDRGAVFLSSREKQLKKSGLIQTFLKETLKKTS